MNTPSQPRCTLADFRRIRFRRGTRTAFLFVIVALTGFAACPRAEAQNQTVSGDLGVTGEMDVYGNTLNFGSWATSTGSPGLSLAYAEDTSHAATLTLNMTRPVTSWLWQQASPTIGASSMPQMRLDATNTLTLYDRASPTANAAIVLSPTGTSTFAAATVFNGTTNRMPNQTAADAASVLTVGLADSRYLVSNTAGSLAIGSGASVSGNGNSLALGNGAVTASDYSSAVGKNSSTAAFAASAYGYGATASGYVSTAIGTSSSSTGNYSAALGYASAATGTSSLALGVGAQSTGWNSAALGNNTLATGYDATALGPFAVASNTCCVALGTYSEAIGYFSTALGFSAESSGSLASALGNYSMASGDYTTALGGYSTASGYMSVALGYGSVANGDDSTTLGEGSGASGANSAALGYHSSSAGPYSLALGNYSSASGSFATALATNAVASGDYSTAAGNTTTVAYASCAVGSGNVGGGDPHNWVATDPLFEVGNSAPAAGTPASDALVVYKNGNATFQGVVTVAPGGDIPMYTGN